jgi:hypothetical protein
MTITVRVIADSISPAGQRLTTFQLRYPRFIHAEELTHRILSSTPEAVIYEALTDGLMYDKDLSRNASSSRAIPVNRMIEDIQRDPVVPIHWGANQPGMQAHQELDPEGKLLASCHWLDALDEVIVHVKALVALGLHKQIANRLLEPWAHINVVCTATSYANFFALRSHEDAQPEIKELSDLMQHGMLLSVPRRLEVGEWHLPYVEAEDWTQAVQYLQGVNGSYAMPRKEEIYAVLRKVSTARNARVSYLTHDGRKTTLLEDIELHNKLVVAEPLHASPAEHVATPDRWLEGEKHGYWEHEDLHGNLVGWQQYRKLLPSEFVAG